MTPRYSVTITPAQLVAHREQLCAWVAANGIDPHTVPLTHPIQVEGGPDGPVIRYRCFFVRDLNGRKLASPRDPDEAWTADASTPCTVPPPRLDTPAP